MRAREARRIQWDGRALPGGRCMVIGTVEVRGWEYERSAIVPVGSDLWDTLELVQRVLGIDVPSRNSKNI